VCVLAELLKMVSQMQAVVVKCMERVQQKTYVPRFSYGRGLLRDDSGPNRLFFTYLLGDDALAISFLQDAKLAIVLGASLNIFTTRTLVRIGFRSCMSTK
jgi:hypothetical protein